MDFNLLLRNRHVARIVVGIPAGHDHVRARIESDAGDVITLQEATLAALVRAYLGVSTHPQRQAVELRSVAVEATKGGFAPHQLLEVPADEGALRRELAAPPPEASAPELPAKETAPSTAALHEDDLELDEPAESGELELDEPVDLAFGDVPTHHSKPTKKKRRR